VAQGERGRRKVGEMPGQQGITREEIRSDLMLGVDLDYLDTVVGKRVPSLGIPIFRTIPYSPAPGATDKYQSLRKWYRHNIEAYAEVVIIHRSDLQRSLAKAHPDAVDYLTVEGEEERARHEGWNEPGNEAIEIENWVFPANALNHATVSLDFTFENIKVTVSKNFGPIAEVYYFVNRKERQIFYSHRVRLKK
jgi:hypothetical protein